MLTHIVSWCLNHRLTVVLLSLAVIVMGCFAARSIEIDAFPDTTPVMVQINTVAPALSSEEIEGQITAPIEQVLSGIAHLQDVRSISKFGLSQVTVVFSDGTDMWFARQQVTERLGVVTLPANIARPTLGPVATGLGEIFHFIVRSRGGDLTAARTVVDWTIAPALRTVPGVAEINAWGGYEKTFEVRIDPERLVAHRLTFATVMERIRAANLSVGGGVVPSGGEVMTIQGLGRVSSLSEIENIVVAAHDGASVHVRDIAEVAIGHEIRRGAVTAGGEGEAVLGLGFMLMGANPHDVASRLNKKLEEIRPFLPPDIELTVVYDRTELVDHVLDTVRSNLCEGGLLVIAILFIFLGNLRAGLIVAAAIPLSMMCAFDGMMRFGISASLLSLGAMDFGMVVDSSVIMIENAVRRLNSPADAGRPRLDVIRDAAIEVRKPTLFGELIIIMVYLPILTLEGIEGKLFQPMALTVVFALVGSMVLSLTVMPVLASYFLRPHTHEQPPVLVRLLSWMYLPVLQYALRYRVPVVLLCVTAVCGSVMLFRGLGAEFIPKLSEGAIVANAIRLPGTDLATSIRLNTTLEKTLLADFPDEVSYVWGRIGTAAIATDPMGLELCDLFISLKPRSGWTKAKSQSELVDVIQKHLRDLPGQRLAMTQPIEMRMNEMISGVRGDVAIKVFGDNLDELRRIAGDIESSLYGITGAEDISVEMTTGQPSLRVAVDRQASASYGIPAADVLEMVEAVGGIHLGEVTEGQLRFPLVARLPENLRNNATDLGKIPVLTAKGERLPLSSVATLQAIDSALTIQHEWGQRRIVIQCNVRGRDMASFVTEAQQVIAKDITLPPGRYRIAWGGQFENLQAARLRLAIVVPVALISIFILLTLSLRSVRLAALVFTAVPVAAVGGVAALWLRDIPFSISAAVGFIALAGVAVLNGLVMVTFIRQLRAQGLPVHDAIIQGSIIRLRPVLMTALVAAFGFVPMALAVGMGAEVQRPLATVVIGGIVSSTILTLLLIPVLYAWFEPRQRDVEESPQPS